MWEQRVGVPTRRTDRQLWKAPWCGTSRRPRLLVLLCYAISPRLHPLDNISHIRRRHRVCTLFGEDLVYLVDALTVGVDGASHASIAASELLN